MISKNTINKPSFNEILFTRKIRAILLILSLPTVYISATPIIYAIMWALCGTKTYGVLEVNPSLRWFKSLFIDQSLIPSIILSSIICFIATCLSIFFIIILCYYSMTLGKKYEKFVASAILLPLLFPTIVYAIALQYIIGITKIPEIVGLILANIALLMPVQLLIMKAAHGHMPRAQLFAAATLGASPRNTMIKVYIPQMINPIIISLMVGVFLSFDEVVIAIFVWNGKTDPIAKHLWDLFGRSSEPIPAVISLSLIFVIIILLGTINCVRNRFIKTR